MTFEADAILLSTGSRPRVPAPGPTLDAGTGC